MIKQTNSHDTQLARTEEKEASLIAAAKKGDFNSFHNLISPYELVLKKIILSIIHDTSDAEEIFYEAFYQAWEKFGGYSREQGKFLGWMITLTRRRAIDALRKRACYGNVLERFTLTTSHINIGRLLPNQHEVERHELLKDFHQVLERKVRQPHHRRWAKMHFLEGLSHREIATKEKRSPGTIKTGLRLAREQLKMYLEHHLGN